MTDIEETLKDRRDRHGDFGKRAITLEGLMNVIEFHVTNWSILDMKHRMAIRGIVNNLSSILTGDPHYRDHWHDIQGFARLAEDGCRDGDEDKQLTLNKIRIVEAQRDD